MMTAASSLVSSVDPNLEPKHHLHMKNNDVFRKWEASCCQHNSWQFLVKTKCRRQRQSVIPGEIVVIRLAKEVAEQRTKTSGRNTRIAHLFIYIIKNGMFATFTPPEKVDSNRCDPQNTIRRNIFHRLLLVYRTRDPLPMNVIRKRKEAEKFEFARWPQASKFSSWKVSVRRGMTTGSARPRLINEWSAEIDLASGAAESDFFDKHEFEFESLDPRIADVDFSSATKGCIRWRVNGKAAEKPLASRRRRRFRRLRQSWAEIWYNKEKHVTEKPVAKTIKLEGNPLHEEPVLQLRWKVKTTWRSYERFDVNLAILGTIHDCHSSGSGSSRKDYDLNLFCKELSLENNGTAFQGDRKAGQCQTENAGRSWLISKIWGGCRQAYCTVELVNTPLPKSASSSILYSVWERWETILLNPGRAKFTGIRTTIISRIWIELMDNLLNSSGRFSQDSLQWDLQSDSTDDERITVWTRELTGRILFMSMFNDTVWDVKGNGEICEKQFKDNKRVCSKIPRGNWSFPGQDLKRSGTELANANRWILGQNCRENAAELRRSGHPIFRRTSALEEISEARKWKEVNTLHDSTKNIELPLETVISVNQLSIYGAVADMIEEYQLVREPWWNASTRPTG